MPRLTEKRSKKAIIAERIRKAKTLLDIGFKKEDLAPKLQRDYNISRSTAYRYLDSADLERSNEETLHWIEDQEPLSLDDKEPLMRMARQLMMESYEEFLSSRDSKHVKSFNSLATTYEKFQRMGGKCAETEASRVQSHSNF